MFYPYQIQILYDLHNSAFASRKTQYKYVKNLKL